MAANCPSLTSKRLNTHLLGTVRAIDSDNLWTMSTIQDISSLALSLLPTASDAGHDCGNADATAN